MAWKRNKPWEKRRVAQGFVFYLLWKLRERLKMWSPSEASHIASNTKARMHSELFSGLSLGETIALRLWSQCNHQRDECTGIKFQCCGLPAPTRQQSKVVRENIEFRFRPQRTAASQADLSFPIQKKKVCYLAGSQDNHQLCLCVTFSLSVKIFKTQQGTSLYNIPCYVLIVS